MITVRKGFQRVWDGVPAEVTWAAAIFLFWFSMYTYPSFLSGYVQNVLGAGSVLVGW